MEPHFRHEARPKEFNLLKFCLSDVFVEGLATAKKAYEISKSLDFGWDFEISELISGFRERFRDFVLDFKISGKISRFRVRFQDFSKISRKISRFRVRFPDFRQDF